jgi:hypothetical protein
MKPPPPPPVSWRGEEIDEALGTRKLHGVEGNDVEANGYRVTLMSPKGANGGNPSVVTVDESWSAWSFGTLEEIKEDLEHGMVMKQELLRFESGEPDPALFLPPADYEVTEHTPPGPSCAVSGSSEFHQSAPPASHQ